MKIIFVLAVLIGFVFAEDDGKEYLLVKEGESFSVGMRLEEQTRFELKNGKMEITGDGVAITGKISEVEDQIVIKERTGSDSFLLKFEKRQKRSEALFEGEEENGVSERPLHGSTVRVNQVAGKWAAKVVKGEQVEKDKGAIEKQLRRVEENVLSDHAKSLYGAIARKIGDSWEVMDPLLPGFRSAKKVVGAATVTFEKVEKFQGEACAVLLVEFDFTVDFSGRGAVVMELAGEGNIRRSLASLFDLDFAAKAMMKKVNQGDGESFESSGKCLLSRKIKLLPAREKK